MTRKPSALLLKPDGSKAIARPKGKKFDHKELQKLIGGYFQILPSSKPHFLLVVDDDGRAKGLEPNLAASQLYTGARQIVGCALHVPRELL